MACRYYFGYRIASYKMANVEVADARVLRMHEVLLAIKLVKFYVWERSFARQVADVSACAWGVQLFAASITCMQLGCRQAHPGSGQQSRVGVSCVQQQ